MAELVENGLWVDGIYQLETDDPVVGGPPDLATKQGIDNIQAQQLANRTAFLKAAFEAFLAAIDADTLEGHGADEFMLLANLAAFKSQLVSEIMPLGSWRGYHGDTAPVGHFFADGATYLRADFPDFWAWVQTSGALAVDEATKEGPQFGPGDGATTFSMCDFRGLHPRVLDGGAGIDVGRLLGSYQADEIKAHSHYYLVTQNNNAQYDITNEESGNKGRFGSNTGSTGGPENRVKTFASNVIFYHGVFA